MNHKSILKMNCDEFIRWKKDVEKYLNRFALERINK